MIKKLGLLNLSLFLIGIVCFLLSIYFFLIYRNFVTNLGYYGMTESEILKDLEISKMVYRYLFISLCALVAGIISCIVGVIVYQTKHKKTQ